MATTKLYLDQRGKAKDGKKSILITIAHNRTVAFVPTGIRIFPDEWRHEKVIKIDNAEIINATLAEKKHEIDRTIAMLSMEDNFSVMTATDIKHSLGRKPKCCGHLISDIFEEYLQQDLKEGTKVIYRTTLKKIRDFSGECFKIENVTTKWIYKFEQHLAKTQGVNGRSIFLRSLRAVCNYAYRTGTMANYPFKQYKLKSEPTRKRSVSADLLRRLLNYPVTPSQALYRDYFFLMFYLIGINSKDLLLAKKTDVANGRLEYIREKTNKKYSVRLEPEAIELIERHAGDTYLVDAMEHCKLYRSFAHMMNDSLKTIGKTIIEEIPDENDLFAPVKIVKRIEPVIPGLSTYYARHSWATIAYDIGISLDTISQALGHSSGNRTTLIYVKFDQEKVDEANRKVIDYLLHQVSIETQ